VRLDARSKTIGDFSMERLMLEYTTITHMLADMQTSQQNKHTDVY